MASIRPSGSPPPPPSSTPVETWAVRLAFGLMLVGMGGFVVYDLLEPGRAKASTESDEPTVEEVAPPAGTTPERQPFRPSRFSKSSRAPAAPARAATNHDDSEEEEEEEIATNAVAPSNPTERAPRSFLGSPIGRMRPGDMGLRPISNQPPPVHFAPRPEPEPEPPPPADPPPEQPTDQPAETIEQPSEQPTDQPTDQLEEPTDQPDQPTDQPDQPTDQPDQPTDQPIDQPEQVEPVR
jgi:hypothetical protein